MLACLPVFVDVALTQTPAARVSRLDARYERVREGGVILIALGIDWEGRRQVLAVAYANRESQSRWRDFLLQLQARGVRLVVRDDHPGLKVAIREVWPGMWWQRCDVHFLRNALDYLPRKADDDCLQELRWMYERRNVDEARRDLQPWLEKWGGKYPKLCAWVEANIEETWTFYRLPLAHHQHLKSTNLLERFNQEIKRRTLVVRISPDEASCLQLVRAVAAEQHEEWMAGSRYLNADLLREPLKILAQRAGEAA
jgi:transposase-like protein